MSCSEALVEMPTVDALNQFFRALVDSKILEPV
jgi:hypothetical protein